MAKKTKALAVRTVEVLSPARARQPKERARKNGRAEDCRDDGRQPGRDI